MNCKQNSEQMMEFFDRTSNDIEIAQLKQHLRTCSKCSEEFQNHKEIVGYLENIELVEPPCDFEKNVMEKVALFEAARKKKKDIFLLAMYGCGTALLTISALVLLLRFRGFSITGLIESFVLSFNSASSLLMTLYNILQTLWDLAVFSVVTILQVLFELVKSYTYLIAIGMGLFVVFEEYTSFFGGRKNGTTKRT